MASAVFSGGNESHWGDRRVSLPKYTCKPTSNPHFSDRLNPNPSHIVDRRDTSNKQFKRHFNDPSPLSAPPSRPPSTDPDGTRSSNRRPNALTDCGNLFPREYVTFNLASYSRIQLYELKQRLISDLARVQGVLERIETRDLECKASLPDYQRREAPELPPSQMAPTCLQVSQHFALNNLPENQAPNNVATEHFQSTDLVGQNSKSRGNNLSGKKRARPISSDRDRKRPVAKGGSSVDEISTSMMKKCKQILEKLMKRKYGWIFNKPVDAKGLGLHDYYVIIKHPMDLGTVKSRLDRNEYKTPQDFAADVRLTFNNAMTYNPKSHQVHAMAELFLKNFEDMFKNFYQKYEAVQQMTCDSPKQIRESGAPEQIPIAKKSNAAPSLPMVLNPPLPVEVLSAVVPMPTALISSPEPVVSPRPMELSKPMVNNLNKRQMTFEEKAKLGLSLQKLPQDKMDHMLQILMKRNSCLPVESGEIELDIEALDDETLWELDRLVGSQKNALSNVKMQCIREDVLRGYPNKTPENVRIQQQTINKVDAEEEDVDIGEDILNNDITPVEIEKDVSGTSSSSTSSSSSDSSSGESGSGSGSDSEDSVQSPYIEQLCL